jgi:ornithine cyclodeaminase/alanine dehydrogenase-like protein (mu-crystallin family)
MSLITDLVGRLVSLALRLVLGLAAAVFALSLLFAGLVALAFMLLRALLTGRKPAPVMVWQRYREASRASSTRWTGRATPAVTPAAMGVRSTPADVVDVTPRDIPPR